MSLTLIKDVATEARRLAIAGSKLAPGDFRLKKLIGPLEKAGTKAPVFAKVAEAASAVVDADANSAAGALLRLATLTNAIAYTQGVTGSEGALERLEHSDLKLSTSQVSYRVLAPLIEALTTVGSGRWEVVSSAHQRGQLADFRLLGPAIQALGDKYAELADLVAAEVLPQFGTAILPALEKDFDPKGGKAQVRRLQVMARLAPEKIRDLCRELVTDGSKEMKVAAIDGLAGSEEDVPQLIELTKARAKDVRRAAYRALAQCPGAEAAATVRAGLTAKDLDVFVDAMTASSDSSLIDGIVAEADTTLAIIQTEKGQPAAAATTRLVSLLRGLTGRNQDAVQQFLQRCLASRAAISRAEEGGFQLALTMVTTRMLEDGDKNSIAALVAAAEDLTEQPCQDALEAAHKSLTPQEFYKRYAPVAKNHKKSQFGKEVLHFIGGGEGTDARYLYHWPDEFPDQPMDDRWLDLAISADHSPSVFRLARPGHKKCAAYIRKFTTKKGADTYDRVSGQRAMFAINHPDALETFETVAKSNTASYVLVESVRAAPEELWPKLEALCEKLDTYLAEGIYNTLAEARARKAAK